MGDVKLAKEVDAFIRRRQGREGGQERANYVSFLKELISLLDLPSPDPADATHEHNDYSSAPSGRTRTTRPDRPLQKNSFVLEAKQSRLKGKKVPGQNDLFTADIPEGYDGACEHLRSDIMRARKLFPDTNALLTGPQHGVADDALGARSHQPGP